MAQSPHVPLLSLVAAGLLALAGCGDDPGAAAPSPTTPATPTATPTAPPTAPADAGPAAPEAPAPTPAPGAQDAPGGTHQAAALPDLSQGLETGSCGNGPGNEGADSQFVGRFTIDGTQVRGTEQWFLHANDKLQASSLWTAGSDCMVRWNVVGTTTAPRHCGDCDLGLELRATVDMTGSTCPEDLVKREKTMEMAYDVRRADDGVAWFYFASSGKLLGQGYHADGGLTFVTQHQCKWF